jgi:filamentous hemagglutinin family protein
MLYSSTCLSRFGFTCGLLGMALLPLSAHALPVGGKTTAGVARGTQSAHAWTITQETGRAVIDWRSFDIGTGESVIFRQPSASAAILNRIHDIKPSEILGKLSSNGTVVLSNPHGMVFGKGAQVDVGGLIATTADIGNDAFMAQGALSFDKAGNPAASVVNHGSITAKDAGLVALVAPRVKNDGVIVANRGKVTLAGAERFTYDLYGDGLVGLAGSAPNHSVTHNGKIIAHGGKVLLSTAEAGALVDGAINVDGLVDASSAYAQGGEIIITGEDAAVRLEGDALLAANGRTGGGNIRIGGDYLGSGATPKARTTRIADGAQLTADATDRGDGGRVIVWSEKHTVFGGLTNRSPLVGEQTSIASRGGEQTTRHPQPATITAKGGARGGNGGFVETSSRHTLTATGLVHASAPKGNGGQWLLDPNNVTIQAGGADTNVTASPNFSTTNDTAIVTTGSIETALNGGTSVTVATTSSGANSQSGDITLNDPIAKTAGGNATLTLQADNSIFVNGNITSTSGALNVTLHADKSAPTGGSVTLTNATIDTNGGNLTIGGGANPALNPAVGQGADNDGVEISNSVLTTGTGNISIRGQGRDAAGNTGMEGVRILGGSVVQTTSGNITITGAGGNGTNNLYGIFLGDAGTRVTSADGDIAITGTGGTGTTANNYGVYINNGADITSTGTGPGAATIALNGTGGTGTVSNYGVVLTSTGTGITSVDGDISVTGQGGNGSGNANYGFFLLNDADITSTGTGADAARITLSGTGGNGAGNNYGMRITDAGTLLSSVDGDISLTGVGSTSASGTNNDGIRLDIDLDILTTGSADITLTGTAGANANSQDIQTVTGAIVIGGGTATGDFTFNFNNYSLANLSVQTTGDITLQPRTAGTTVGVAGGAGTLDLSTTVLGMMNWGDTLFLGRTDGTGAVTVNAYNWAGENVHLRSGSGTITVNGAQSNLGDFTLTTNADPVINASITGTGDLLLQTSGAATTMGLGGAAGTVNFSTADLGQFGGGWAGWQLGNTATTGTLSLGAHSWSDPVTFSAAPAGTIAVTGNQTVAAASDASFTFGGPVSLGATIDSRNGAGAAKNLTFNSPVTLTNASPLLADSGTVAFNGTLDGSHALGVTTTGSVGFNGTVGGTNRLGAVTLANPGNVSSTAGFNAASLSLTGGTGTVGFSGAGLNTTGDIHVATNNAVTGTYTGANGNLNAGAGAVNATASFQSLNIVGSSATLLAGNIGVAEAPSQTMANRIAVNNVLYPALTPNLAYTFAGYVIGAEQPLPVHGSPLPDPEPPAPPAVPEAPPAPPQAEGPVFFLPGIGYLPPDIARDIIRSGIPVAATQEKTSGATEDNSSDEEAMLLFDVRRKDADRTGPGRLIRYSEDLLEQLGCTSGNDKSCEGME